MAQEQPKKQDSATLLPKPPTAGEYLGRAFAGALKGGLIIAAIGAAIGAVVAGGISGLGAEETVKQALNTVNLVFGSGSTTMLALGGAALGSASGFVFGSGAGAAVAIASVKDAHIQKTLPVVINQAYESGREVQKGIDKEICKQEAISTHFRDQLNAENSKKLGIAVG